ncbi:FMN-binding negative transcriptional regulator [Niveibacterium sp. 24ML]|uniref:FMN-binding negative transcriptional regulator n=1 Tax=Niveibacterium sp. 24ML TaxID=2985512 RepID=UPI00226F90F3|nr:FMN-binding negative transcriptional regulator [Niveibacterium sp. 24ML]MCX9156276.1 FMN-binding negative transcriptional regulator [Niveibacterium sp. 24ML]
MTLYVPDHFAAPDRDAIIALIAQHPFATLISVAEGEPVITHLPLVADPTGTLVGHVAHSNPHAALLADGAAVTAVFHGPHVYVSPTWYEQPGVPTWNYATVHVHAKVRVIEGEAAQAMLDHLIDTFDPDPLGETGTRHLRQDERAGMQAHIHCFALDMQRVEAKFKLSQNKSPADRLRVISALGQQDNPDADAIASLMMNTLATGR